MKIVLTGGPGAGKTAVLETVRRCLTRQDFALIPEAASILFSGGFPRTSSLLGLVSAQRAIVAIQRELEVIYGDMKGKKYFLCDRGIPDGLAYWPQKEDSFWKMVGKPREEILASYDVVIHLRTPTLELGYTTATNPARTETADQARDVDAKIAQAWEGHPHRYFIDDYPDFRDKITEALDLIAKNVVSSSGAYYA